MALARVLVQESENDSPGGSPAPLRKTLVSQLQRKTQGFRWVLICFLSFFISFYLSLFVFLSLSFLLILSYLTIQILIEAPRESTDSDPTNCWMIVQSSLMRVIGGAQMRRSLKPSNWTFIYLPSNRACLYAINLMNLWTRSKSRRFQLGHKKKNKSIEINWIGRSGRCACT